MSEGEALAAGGPAPSPAASTPERALALLEEGNARFIAGKSQCGPLTARRLELTSGQSPFAALLGCSDSRVPLETIFDQGPGHLFVVRLAGNFLTSDGIGTLEYGVAALHTPLIVILGHSSCGAVDATVKYVESGKTQPGHIMDLVQAIEPAAKSTKGQPGNWLENAIERNVRDNVASLPGRSTIVADAVNAKSVRIVGGVYDLHTGKVNFF